MKLVKFSADWCANCKLLTKLMDGMDIPIEVQQVDVDKEPEIAQQYGIRGVPTLLLVDDEGKELRRIVGMTTAEHIKDLYS